MAQLAHSTFSWRSLQLRHREVGGEELALGLSSTGAADPTWSLDFIWRRGCWPRQNQLRRGPTAAGGRAHRAGSLEKDTRRGGRFEGPGRGRSTEPAEGGTPGAAPPTGICLEHEGKRLGCLPEPPSRTDS